MGLLQECSISNSEGVKFKGYAWTREDGTFEAFWYEGGNRVTQFFNSNGKPLGFFNSYRLSLG
jgi:hypothetical protein